MSRLIRRHLINVLVVSRSCFSRTSAPFASSLNVFDRETKRLQRIRTALDPGYKNYDYVKEEVGYRVADRVFDIKRSFDNVLDLGCQRGYVSKHLTKDTVNKIYMLEMADKVLVSKVKNQNTGLFTLYQFYTNKHRSKPNCLKKRS